MVVTYPIYLLVHRFIGYEYLQVEEKESLRIHFTPIVIGVSFAFLSYGLLNDYSCLTLLVSGLWKWLTIMPS